MERLTEVENGTAMVKGCGSNCKYGFEHCRKGDWENESISCLRRKPESLY